MEETLDTHLAVQIQDIKDNEALTDEEKEEAISDIEYYHRRTFEGNYEALLEQHGDQIQTNVIIFRTLELILLLADVILMLSPTILLYNGYVGLSQIAFVVLGIQGSWSVINVSLQEGMKVNARTMLNIIIIFVVIQAPYLVLNVISFVG